MPAPGFISPFWQILPEDAPTPPSDRKSIDLRLRPGAGWGTGSHETTQLCLRALGHLAPKSKRPWRMLDFGAGAGLLAIGAAKLGAEVDAVEIDAEGLANAGENAALNRVDGAVKLSTALDGAPGPFDLVIANILRLVLLEYAALLCARLRPEGALVLSGFTAVEIPELSVRYGELLPGHRHEAYQQGEWRALVWKPN